MGDDDAPNKAATGVVDDGTSRCPPAFVYAGKEEGNYDTGFNDNNNDDDAAAASTDDEDDYDNNNNDNDKNYDDAENGGSSEFGRVRVRRGEILRASAASGGTHVSRLGGRRRRRRVEPA